MAPEEDAMLNQREEIMSNNVDLVIAYVDNTDPIWKDMYLKNGGDSVELSGVRFRDPARLIRYNLMLIDKYMPWIRTIHLVVSNPEQVPIAEEGTRLAKALEKVHVVLHKDIMPESILPTFNSCTIEMFLPYIEGLSEYFIYINDDMYPVKPLKVSDFFSFNQHGAKIKMDFIESHLIRDNSQFRRTCLRCYRKVIKALGISFPDSPDMFLRPQHGPSPMILSDCKKIRILLDAAIKEHLEPFRDEGQFNQYIYMLYTHLSGNSLKNDLNFRYYGHHHKSDMPGLCHDLKEGLIDILCVNDGEQISPVKFRNDNWMLADTFKDLIYRD